VGGILVSVLVQSGAAALSNTASTGGERTVRYSPAKAATPDSRLPAIAGDRTGETGMPEKSRVS